MKESFKWLENCIYVQSLQFFFFVEINNDLIRYIVLIAVWLFKWLALQQNIGCDTAILKSGQWVFCLSASLLYWHFVTAVQQNLVKSDATCMLRVCCLAGVTWESDILHVYFS